MASDNSPALSQIGYCPQFDALNMRLTAKENMIFYANIRGFLPDEIEPVKISGDIKKTFLNIIESCFFYLLEKLVFLKIYIFW